jgi:hypothetical protein
MHRQLVHRLRSARLGTVHAQRGCRGVKPRRLAVERVEDRFLLSADFQAGMELQLDSPQDNPGFIAILSPVSQSPVSCSLDVALDMTTVASVSFASDRVWSNAGSGFKPISMGDLPLAPTSYPGGAMMDRARDPDGGMVDLALFPQAPNMTPLEGPKAAAIVTAVQNPSVPPKSAPQQSPPMQTGVDGACGKSVVFDLAMAAPRESRSVSAELAAGLAVPVRAVSLPYAAWLPSRLSELTQLKNQTDEGRPPDASPQPQRPESRVEPEQLPDKPAADARAEAKADADQPLAASTDTGDAKHTPQQGRAISNSQTAEISSDPARAASGEVQSQRIETGLSKAASSAADPTAQDEAGSNALRQAVFAEIGQKAERPELRPNYVDAHQRSRVVGMAIVAVAGQFLSQRFSLLKEPSQTCLVPPRRRGSDR